MNVDSVVKICSQDYLCYTVDPDIDIRLYKTRRGFFLQKVGGLPFALKIAAIEVSSQDFWGERL